MLDGTRCPNELTPEASQREAGIIWVPAVDGCLGWPTNFAFTKRDASQEIKRT